VHHHPTRPELVEVDPQQMRRRLMVAALLGLPTAAALPAWASAATLQPTPEGHTLGGGTWTDHFAHATWELDDLAHRYVTPQGVKDRRPIMHTGLMLAAQLRLLAENAPPARARDAHRLAAEAAAFTAGCYVDTGANRAATALYDRAYRLTEDGDLRAFIVAQWDWVAMYDGKWDLVEHRSGQAISMGTTHGGFGLLMGLAHYARARAVKGDKGGATDALRKLAERIPYVAGTDAPHTALNYPACKAHFAAATTYAELGMEQQHGDERGRALADKSLGFVDRQLLRLSTEALDPDPQRAAHAIRMHMVSLDPHGFNHCVRAEAERHLRRLGGKPPAATEARMGLHYLRGVQVAA
jgi:hypothetical protein